MMFSRKNRSRSAPQRTVTIERLDPRLILDAPLALAADGLVLADPAPDELLEPRTAAPPAPSQAAPPVPTLDGMSVRDGLEVPLTTSSSGSQGTATLTMLSLGGISEAIWGPEVNYVRFTAQGCGSPPPSSMTVGISIGGVAEEGYDYESELANGSIIIPMTPTSANTSAGEREVPIQVIHDTLDEVAEESITGSIAAAHTNTGAVVTIVNTFFQTSVASGDYTIAVTQQRTELDADGNPGQTIGLVDVKVTQNNVAIQNLAVTIERAGADDGADVKIRTNDGLADTSDEERTNANGVAQFALTAVAGPAGGGQVNFDVQLTNAEGRPQHKQFSVRVVP